MMKKIKIAVRCVATVTVASLGLSALAGAFAGNVAAESDLSATMCSNLHAVVVGNPDWPYSDMHRGYYTINSDMSLTCDTDANSTTSFTASQPGFYVDGKYFVNKSAVMQYPMPMVQGTGIEVYDTKTGDKIETHNLQSSFLNVALSFAYDRANDIVYAITYGGNTSTQLLTTFDYKNMTFANDKMQLSSRFSTIACDGEGNLYGIKYGTSEYYKIDTIDGKIGDPLTTWSETPKSQTPQGMTFDPESGCMLWAYTNASDETSLISIETDGGRIKKLGNLDKYVVHGLYSTSSLAPSNAPAQVTDLNFDFSSDGSLSGEIVYTVPRLTMGGDAISNSLEAIYLVDNKEIKTTVVSPGSLVKEQYTFDNDGLHTVALILKNGDAKGDRISIDVFAGFDTPSAVGNLTFNQDGNAITLSWDAPTGINNGTLGALSYKVSCNGVDLGTVIERQYTYTATGDMTIHNFEVIAIAGDKIGLPATINGIVAGNPFALPYSCSFDSAEDIMLYTSLNANNDATEWKYFDYYKYVQINKSYGDGACDDYLITPMISFESGNVYSLSFDYETANKNEALSVFLTNGASLQSVRSGEKIFTTTELNSFNKMTTANVLFTMDKTVPMNIAFHCFTEDGLRINIDNIKVENFGKTNAPKPISDLTVIPGANGELKATLSFLTPDEQFDGNLLKSIDRITIERDGTIIKTFENPSPASVITFEDSVDTPGYYDYAISVYNENGAGQPVSVKEYIGAMSLPAAFNQDRGFKGFSISNTSAAGWNVNEADGSVTYSNTGDNGNGDRLTTPYFYLKGGEVVKMRFVYSVFNDSPEASPLSFWVGLSSLQKTVPQNISPMMWVRSGDQGKTSDEYSIVVPEDGVYAYNFTIYYPSNNNSGVRISSIEIETVENPSAPGKVRNINITADKNGELKGTISFDMPVLTLDNQELEGYVDAYVYGPRQEELACISGKQPGERVETEFEMIQGVQYYTIRTRNDKGWGASESWGAFAGEDVPARVESMYRTVRSDNMTVDLFWDDPENGLNKGWYDRSQLKYKLYVNDEYLCTVTEPEYSFEAKDAEQAVYSFQVLPFTPAGEGLISAKFNNTLGAPYKVNDKPFVENFANGEFTTKCWDVWHSNDYENCGWKPESDFKGGDALVLKAFLMTESEAKMPKLNLQGMKKAVLTFDMYKYHGEAPMYQAGQFVRILASDDEINYRIIQDEMGEAGVNPEGWYTITVPLDTYLNKNWLSLKIYGMMHENGDFAAVRNIKVYDSSASGIDVSVTDGVSVEGMAGKIIISGTFGVAEVFNVNGQLVARTIDAVIDVDNGLYIVKISDLIFKVIVK